MTNDRDFKGVWVPKEVWLDGKLNALDKIILAEVDSLDQGEKGCYASNKYIAEFCQCSETKVSTAISKLIQLGYLYVQNFDGRQRILKSRLSNFERQTSKKRKAESQNLKEINIEINTNNNTEKERKKETTYDSIIVDYTSDEELKNTIYEFIKMRKLIKKPLTDNALRLMLKKLDRLARNDNEKIQILNNSITGSWQGIYALKEENREGQKKKLIGPNGIKLLPESERDHSLDDIF